MRIRHGSEDRAAALADASSPDFDTLRALLLPALPDGTQLSSMRWSSVYRVSHRIVPAYSRGRVFIAGDAAHIHPPVGGQGMNTGLQDARNLAWKLALAARDLAQPELLESYSEERPPVGVDVVQSTSAALNAVFAREVATPAARNPVARHLSRQSHRRRRVSRHGRDVARAGRPRSRIGGLPAGVCRPRAAPA